MNNFIQTLKNIWSIKELRDKITYTLIILAVFRIGSSVLLPGVNSEALSNAYKGAGNNLLDLINSFSGGAFTQGSILALGIMPYITASIIIQLLGFAVPYFQKLQQKEGESGRKKLNQYTRILTVLITLVQGSAYLALLKNTPGAIDPNVNPNVFFLGNSIILSAGTIFSMWLGERITDRGIGNGISLLIMIGIIATLPRSFVGEVQGQLAGRGILMVVIEIAALFMVILASILIIQGVRKIPIQFAKRMVGRGSESIPTSGARDYIPLKVNASGVMPIIFAQAIMFLPLTLAQYTMDKTGTQSDFLLKLNDWLSLPYNMIFFALIMVFTYIYTALIVNPKNYAEHLKRNNSFIPGVKPGEDTEEYIDSLTTRVTLPGSIFLGFIAVLPAIVGVFGVSPPFARFFGGTSLLIMVGVILDTLAQIESYLLMRKYDGLVKTGAIKGRSPGGIQIGAGY